MNLRIDLLIRMTMVGILCWLGASAYLVAQSGQREAQEVMKVADQIRPIMTWDVMRRFGSVDTDARYPDLGGAASRFPNPVCLRYRAKDGETSDWAAAHRRSAATCRDQLRACCERWVLDIFQCLLM